MTSGCGFDSRCQKYGYMSWHVAELVPDKACNIYICKKNSNAGYSKVSFTRKESDVMDLTEPNFFQKLSLSCTSVDENVMLRCFQRCSHLNVFHVISPSYEGCCFLDEAYLIQISQLMGQTNCLARAAVPMLKLALVKGCLLQAVNP